MKAVTKTKEKGSKIEPNEDTVILAKLLAGRLKINELTPNYEQARKVYLLCQGIEDLKEQALNRVASFLKSFDQIIEKMKIEENNDLRLELYKNSFKKAKTDNKFTYWRKLYYILRNGIPDGFEFEQGDNALEVRNIVLIKCRESAEDFEQAWWVYCEKSSIVEGRKCLELAETQDQVMRLLERSVKKFKPEILIVLGEKFLQEEKQALAG